MDDNTVTTSTTKQSNYMDTQIIEALVLETAKDLTNAQTGDDQALTKLITVAGDLINIWHTDNRLPAQSNEEVLVAISPSNKTNPTTGKPYLNYAIIPAAFAAKIQSNS